MSRFKDAIDVVLAQEGGYVNDPLDPGGETNWGISKRSHPTLDIKALTREDAIEIYRRDFWEPNKVALIKSQEIADKYFSFLVNMGTHSAGRMLQRALRAVGRPVEIDGWVGTVTREAVNDTSGYYLAIWERESKRFTAWKSDPVGGAALLAAIRSEAAGHYRLLIEKNPRLERFRDGWLNRAYE